MRYNYEQEIQDIFKAHSGRSPEVIAAIIQGAATIRAADIIAEQIRELATSPLQGAQIEVAGAHTIGESIQNVAGMLDLLQSKVGRIEVGLNDAAVLLKKGGA